MNLKVTLSTLFMVCALAACGGGGGSAGTPSGGSGTGPAPITANDFTFELSKNQIQTTGADSVTLTVTAVNSARNVVAGLPVTVSVDSGVFTPSANVTDASGRYTGTIAIGGNPAIRNINATIVASGVTKVASIQVAGSELSVTTTPANPLPGQVVTVDVVATNASSVGVSGATITLGGDAIQAGSRMVVTNANGRASTTFNAPAVAGNYTLNVSGLGIVRPPLQIQVNPSVGTPSNLPISAASLTAQLTSIPPNIVGSSTSRSRLSARFLNASNTGVQNLRVRFEIESPTLPGASLSTDKFTVLTDASGTAESDYIAGTRISPTNGVMLKACYSTTDFSSPDDCPQSVRANLTVASQPLSITISNNNTLQSGLGNIAYIQQFLIQVSDSAGAAVRDAVVSTSVNITHFGKGVFTAPNYQVAGSIPPNAASTFSPTAVPTSMQRVWCANEDINRNGSLDTLPTAEDINGNGRLEPRQAEIIVAFVSGNRTDANGQMLIQVSYGQNVGSWLAFTLRATTNVAGSEGLSERAFVTGFLEGDLDNGSFRVPPYGVGSCVNPN